MPGPLNALRRALTPVARSAARSATESTAPRAARETEFLANAALARKADDARWRAVMTEPRGPQESAAEYLARRSVSDPRGALAQVARSVTGRGTNVIKDRGGNWVPDTLEEYLSWISPIAPHGRPGHNPQQRELEGAVDKWLQTQLKRYIMTDMGTLDDPIAALEREGISHYSDPGLKTWIAEDFGLGERVRPSSFATPRGWNRADKFHYEKTARGGHDPFTGDPIGRNHRTQWEQIADGAILRGNAMPGTLRRNIPDRTLTPQAAKNLVEQWAGHQDLHRMQIPEREAMEYARVHGGTTEEAQMALHMQKNYGWLDKLPANTQLHRLAPEIQEDPMQFGHIRDYLMQSGMTPQQISRVSVPDAVRATSEWNKKLARQKTHSVLNHPDAVETYKDYPEKGFRWVKIGPKAGATWDTDAGAGDPLYKAVQDALKEEGQHMGHCVGGYCDDVMAGTEIYSLRDKDGFPHVTVEVEPQMYRDIGKQDLQEYFERHPEGDGIMKGSDLYDQIVKEYNTVRRDPDQIPYAGFDHFLSQRYRSIYDEINNQEVPPIIRQIKGKQNARPNDEYLPFVQDFVLGREWTEVHDLPNTGLRKVPKIRSLTTRDGSYGEIGWPRSWGDKDVVDFLDRYGGMDPRVRFDAAAVADHHAAQQRLWQAFFDKHYEGKAPKYYSEGKMAEFLEEQRKALGDTSKTQGSPGAAPEPYADGGLVDEVAANMQELLHG